MVTLQFIMQRLAALVPRPRLHLLRFHGVLAPNAKPRALVVPKGLDNETGASGPGAGAAERGCAHTRPGAHRLLEAIG